jgi:hypothetical protein
LIFKNYPWDPSDQPTVLKKEDKKKLRENSGGAIFQLLLLNLFLFPYLFLKFLFSKLFTKTTIQPSKQFYGLCVNLDKGAVQYELVEELGVESLQIRFYLSDMDTIDKYVEFAKGFGDKNIVVNVIQSREHIENQTLLENDIIKVFEKFGGLCDEFIIGHTINRIKWGFVSIKEYLEFFEVVQNVRDTKFSDIKLIGSSVIDFEYHFTIGTLFNNYKIHFDKVASLLYVDRRGSAKNTQYGIFDLKNKIEFLDTIVKSSSKCDDKIIISETNWPLKGTAPYAPTSEKECVSEEEYTKYMIEYFDIAKQSGKIETIYWHQLIAPGYGLVDNKDGQIRKMPQFYAFKKLVESCDT